MKFLALAAILASASAVTVTTEHRASFREYTQKFGKVYQTQGEHERRLSIYAENMAEFAKLNRSLRARGRDEIHGANAFTDMTREEFNEIYLTGAVVDEAFFPKLDTVKEFPTVTSVKATRGSYSLYDEGLVTPVKDQAQCGSCWAFAATETVESAWAVAGNDLTEFSPQQIVSCDTGNGDYGCSGGMPSSAFEYVISAGGMATEEDYPYTSTTGITGTCQDFTVSGGTVSEWAYAQDACLPGSSACVEDSDAIASALKSYGGIAIAIDASAFFSYTGGVMTSDSCSSDPSSLDHAIQIVGYDASGTTPYWIVRNSWAESWGEDGLIKMEMGTNTCGLANIAALVTAV